MTDGGFRSGVLSRRSEIRMGTHPCQKFLLTCWSYEYLCSLCGGFPLSVSAQWSLQLYFILEKRDHLVCRIEKIYERTVADTEGVEQEDGGDAVVEHVCSK